MKNTSIQLTYDAAKLAATRQYIAKRGESLETELAGALQRLYEKHVPPQVREYIEACASEEKPARPRPASHPRE